MFQLRAVPMTPSSARSIAFEAGERWMPPACQTWISLPATTSCSGATSAAPSAFAAAAFGLPERNQTWSRFGSSATSPSGLAATSASSSLRGPQHHVGLHAEAVGDRGLELLAHGLGRLAARHADVPALQQRADVLVAALLEQRPQLGHRHAPLRAEVHPAQERHVAGHQRTATSSASANGGTSSMRSPLQKRPGSYQLAGRREGSRPIAW